MSDRNEVMELLSFNVMHFFLTFKSKKNTCYSYFSSIQINYLKLTLLTKCGRCYFFRVTVCDGIRAS